VIGQLAEHVSTWKVPLSNPSHRYNLFKSRRDFQHMRV